MRHTRIKASPPRPSVVMHSQGLPFLPPRNANRKRDRHYSELPAGLNRQKIAVPVTPAQTKSVKTQPTRPILSENPNE